MARTAGKKRTTEEAESEEQNASRECKKRALSVGNCQARSLGIAQTLCEQLKVQPKWLNDRKWLKVARNSYHLAKVLELRALEIRINIFSLS